MFTLPSCCLHPVCISTSSPRLWAIFKKQIWFFLQVLNPPDAHSVKDLALQDQHSFRSPGVVLAMRILEFRLSVDSELVMSNIELENLEKDSDPERGRDLKKLPKSN